MPPHDVYIEPFLGAGAVMRMKRPAKLNIGIDIDPQVIAAWLAAASPEAQRLEDPRAENAEARSRQYLELASLVLPSGPGRFSFWISDAKAWMNGEEDSILGRPTTLVYCDPPYLHSTRVQTRQYAFEMTEAKHLEVLSLLRELPCKVMISGYSSPMYAKALKSWNATSFQAGTRGRPAAEWVWYNFDRPTELHDYRYLGNNYRERERLKRIRTRWTRRLERMPLIERQALLSAIASTAPNAESGRYR